MNIRRDDSVAFDVWPLIFVIIDKKLFENVRNIIAQLVGLLELQLLVDELSIGIGSVPAGMVGQSVLTKLIIALFAFRTFERLPAGRRSVIGHPGRNVRMETAHILDWRTIGHIVV